METSKKAIILGSDHGGYALKIQVIDHLKELGLPYEDIGPYDDTSCDYPDYADIACKKIQSGEADRAILICGTGIGMSMAANKHDGIRAAVCADTFSARMTRLHNDANVLCLGERTLGPGLAFDIVDLFLCTEFQGGRHARRVGKVMDVEKTR